MKKLINFSAVAMLLAMTSCISPDIDLETQNPNVDGLHKVQIQGTIEQLVKSHIDDYGFWAGDCVGLYLVNYDGENAGTLHVEGNQADNVKFTNSEDGTWTSEYDIYYKDHDTKVDFYGYYPYATPNSIEEYPFEVAKNQSTPAEHGKMATYEASDFLWAKAESISPTSSKVNLKFNHKMSSVRVRFTQGEGWTDAAEYASVKKEVLITNTIRKSTINLSSGVVTPEGEVPLDGIIPAKDGDEFRAIIVPQSIEVGKNVLVITIDGTPRQFVRNEVTNYLPSKMTTFDLAIKKSTATGDYEVELLDVSITPWEADNVSHQDDAREYVVIHNSIAGQLERYMVDRLEMDITAIKNLKITGKISTDDYNFMRDRMTSLMRINLKEVESLIDGVYQIPESAFYDKKSLIKCIFPDKLERIGERAFSNSSLTGTAQLPEGLKYVSGFGNTKITNVQFPSTLEEIGYGAFQGCAALMCEISLPHSLKRIEESAFFESAIKGNLALPEELEYIGGGAFFRCSNLTGSLTIPNGTKTIYCKDGVFGAFQECGFTGNLTLPMGLEEIQDYTFSGTKFKGELNIPSTVTTIGHRAFRNTEFNGTLVLPKELISLGSEAFAGCGRLSGIVEIPENIISIPKALFANCKNIEGIVLHRNVEVIEASAFENCYYIYSIVSKAKNPPTINSSSFNGVAKDNFVVEVPEDAVKKYQFASGWNEFRRVEAHRDFSISRNRLRVLNAEHSKTLVMRAPAGEAWSVESCPEWVTITPSSGVGKVDVAITVNEMAAGDVGTFKTGTVNSSGKVTYSTHAGRGGEVVFLLNGKDYRTRITVEQYDYEYGDGDLINLQEKTVGNGVNIVLMGDCFDAKDISEGKYLKAMQDAYDYFFDIEPYVTYRHYFNVYAVFGMSADSGMGTVNTIREARFGSQYTLNAGVSPDFETIFAGACVAPISDDVVKTLIILIENSNEYGGGCSIWKDGSAVALVPMSTDPAPYDFRGRIHHDAGGHGFAKLGDENIKENSFVCGGCEDRIHEMKKVGFYENISLTGSMHDVTWSHMIYDPQYSNVVDIYEGAHNHTRGVWRSEATSCMNNNIPYYNAISRESMVKRIMNYAGESYSYEAFKALDHESLPSTKSATRACDGASVGSSSQLNHRPPKFMGEKPQFDKDKF